MSLFCRVLGHRVAKNRVWHDDIDFRANCLRCGAPLIRDDERGWRVFDRDKDFKLSRKGKVKGES